MAGGTIELLPKRVNTESLFFIFFCTWRRFAANWRIFRRKLPFAMLSELQKAYEPLVIGLREERQTTAGKTIAYSHTST
jgi:hypothetical protein